jgi:hypothetical protein
MEGHQPALHFMPDFGFLGNLMPPSHGGPQAAFTVTIPHCDQGVDQGMLGEHNRRETPIMAASLGVSARSSLQAAPLAAAPPAMPAHADVGDCAAWILPAAVAPINSFSTGRATGFLKGLLERQLLLTIC